MLLISFLTSLSKLSNVCLSLSYSLINSYNFFDKEFILSSNTVSIALNVIFGLSTSSPKRGAMLISSEVFCEILNKIIIQMFLFPRHRI